VSFRKGSWVLYKDTHYLFIRHFLFFTSYILINYKDKLHFNYISLSLFLFCCLTWYYELSLSLFSWLPSYLPCYILNWSFLCSIFFIMFFIVSLYQFKLNWMKKSFYCQANKLLLHFKVNHFFKAIKFYLAIFKVTLHKLILSFKNTTTMFNRTSWS